MVEFPEGLKRYDSAVELFICRGSGSTYTMDTGGGDRLSTSWYTSSS